MPLDFFLLSSSRKLIKEIFVAHEELACGYGCHFALCMLNRIGVDSIGSMQLTG